MKPVVPDVKPVLTSAVVTKPVATAQRAPTLVVSVSPNARVLRTYVFKAPDRFVVDLVDQTEPIAVLSNEGKEPPRFGKHPEFTRIVLDSAKPIQRGEVGKKGDRLEIHLER